LWQRVSLWDKDWKNEDDLIGSEKLIHLDPHTKEGDIDQVAMRARSAHACP
jgi:hypothetical protein